MMRATRERLEDAKVWRAEVSRRLEHGNDRMNTIEACLKDMHRCMENRFAPLVALQHKAVGILGFLIVLMPILLWWLGRSK